MILRKTSNHNRENQKSIGYANQTKQIPQYSGSTAPMPAKSRISDTEPGKCHNCGFRNQLGVIFCRNCGKKLKPTTPAPAPQALTASDELAIAKAASEAALENRQSFHSLNGTDQAATPAPQTFTFAEMEAAAKAAAQAALANRQSFHSLNSIDLKIFK